MITSQAYKDAINSSARNYRLEGEIGEHSFTDENIVSGSLKIDNQAVNDSDFAFGACYAGLLEVTLRELDITRFTAYGMTIEARFILETADGEEEIPLGVYSVIEAVNAPGGAVAIKAIDAMVRLDAELPYTSDEESEELVFIGEGTPLEILTLACANAGIELINSESDIELLPNGTRIFHILGNGALKTWRDVCVHLLACMGAFGTINRDGYFEVRQFFSGGPVSINPDHIKASEIADISTRFGSVSVVSSGNTITVEVNPEEKRDGDTTLSLGENQFANFGSNEDIEGMLLELLHYAKTIDYVPFKVSSFGDPSYELGAPISVETRSGAIESVITGMTWTYRGDHEVIGVGENIATTGSGFTQREVEAKLAEVGSAIIREKQSIKLYVDSQDSGLLSLIEQQADNVTIRFEGVEESIQGLGEETAASFEEIKTYVRFDTGGLTLGKEGSEIVAKLSNDKLAFVQGETEVAYISNSQLFITDAEISQQLAIGNGNYAFVPRENGNMSLKWIGGS